MRRPLSRTVAMGCFAGLGLVVLLLAGPHRAASAAALDADRLFAADHLVEIEIEIPEADWQALCGQSRDMRAALSDPLDKPFTYFKGNVSIDGVKIEGVGIRKKGFIGSLDGQRPSLKIKFAQYVDQHPIEGLDRLTLNNNKQDSSQVSQFLTYRLFNAAGVHAPRCNFAHVTVNGEDLGIYSHVESVGEPFLRRRYGDGSGNLYEGTLADFHPKSLDRLEAKTNKDDTTRAKVTALAKVLSTPGKLALDEVEKLVDLDSFLKYWAIESLIGFWDGYSNNQNNFFVYANPKNGKLYFMPWGADAAFMGVRGPFGGFGGPAAVSVYAQGILANRLYHADGMADRYRRTMLRLFETVWKEDQLLAAMARIESLVADHLHDRQAGMSGAMDNARRFIRRRRADILEEFENWPADVPDEPRRPMYTVEVGSARGTFAATWHDEPIDDATTEGKADIRLELDGAVVEFENRGAVAQEAQPRRSRFGRGRSRGPTVRPATIVLAGTRASDGETLTLTLSVNRDVFAASEGKTLTVRGTLREGEGGFGFFNRRSMRLVRGQLKLAKVGLNAGDPVSGEFALKIVETRGGFMDRRGRGRRGRP